MNCGLPHLPAYHVSEPWKASFRHALLGGVSPVTILLAGHCTIFKRHVGEPKAGSVYLLTPFWM